MDADPVEVAGAVVAAARDGRFADVEARFAAPLRAVVGAAAVRDAWRAEIAANGAVTGVGAAVPEPPESGRVRVGIPVVCVSGGFTVVMSVDAAGTLQGLRIAAGDAPSWTPPPYADPALFDEHEVTVGDGAAVVPGTVSLPRVDGPVPGVVLLAGGGPFDRDETSGPNKPLKDLAWGLAARGVAVLRFDKVTHTGTVPPDLTMTGEYVPYGVAAVRLLRSWAGVDRVFVAGHSMGGRVAPRVAAAEGTVAGLVLLAGDAQSLHEAAVRVVRYLAALDPGPESDAAVARMTEQAATAAGAGLSSETPRGALPFGQSGAYWLDVRGYDPVATAAALDRPMLVLQGGRDYQVTVEDDLALWRAGLAHRDDVVIRVHDRVNHLLMAGTGVPRPAEYRMRGHVDAAVVADVAAWLTAGQGSFSPGRGKRGGA